jgi:DNA-directed RNA polymerase specialized sigma24 family protein
MRVRVGGRRATAPSSSDALSDQKFHRLSDAELQRLGSDDLVSYIRDATGAGRSDCAQAGLATLCWRHYDDVVRRVRMRVPAGDVEDVAMTAMLAAIKSAFDGIAVGQFVNWLHRIVDRRGIADYHRAREAEPLRNPLPSEHTGEEGVWGDESSEPPADGAVALQSVVDECLRRLSDPHQDVVEHNVFQALDASRTAARVNEAHPDLDPPMSNDNVHQIVSRFRRCVRTRLSDDESR